MQKVKAKSIHYLALKMASDMNHTNAWHCFLETVSECAHLFLNDLLIHWNISSI